MTPFFPDTLSQGAENRLADLQGLIDRPHSREANYGMAKALWAKRKNTVADRPFWAEIERKLSQNHPRPGICQYCEYDRHSHTEHYFPKKHFPDHTFVWTNYLLVCNFCNAICKAEKFAVFDPLGSHHVFHLPITRGTYPIPPTNDAVLINPRIDDPQDFLMLDIGTGIFWAVPGTDIRGREQANYTVELLHLNQNDNLVRYQKKAFDGYLRKLSDYNKVKAATDFPTLLAALTPKQSGIILQNRQFAPEQSRILEAIKMDILDDPFPSAWGEIKAQKEIFGHIAQLFALSPEALDW